MTRTTYVAVPPPKPLMVWDGDCNFCRRWIERWQQETGDRVEYVPFQDASVATRFPEIPLEQFERAIQLIETDGTVYSAAEAVFRSLAYAPHSGWALTLYRSLPGFARVSEWAYRVVAENRRVFSGLTQFIRGEHVERPTHYLTRWLFLRLIGIIYLIAFVSLWTQIGGLLGSNGILPAREYMDNARDWAQREGLGWQRYAELPTLCWFSASDTVLNVLCAGGAALSVLVMTGVAPAISLFLAWLCYLSLSIVGREFLSFQWDALLLETGFLAIFFAPLQCLPTWWRKRRNRDGRATGEPPPSRAVLWLLRWLLFRLMFSSGAVKLSSGDTAWRNLSALEFHYETQPLPTWIGWYAHQLPVWFQQVSCAIMFGIELIVPFLIFAPRRLRFVACGALVALQLLIAATGNYCFFNLLTLALCVLLLDDAFLCKCAFVKRRIQDAAGDSALRRSAATSWPRWIIAPITLIVLLVTMMILPGVFHERVHWPEPLVRLYGWISPFRSANGYGLFAVMTTSRPEITIEGSNDGATWRAYEFRYKPGDPLRRPRFVAPHQPRLDWQMWFAALGRYQNNPWLVRFCERLLGGSPAVLSLMGNNPFPDAPPRYVRAVVYEYRFTDFATRRATGAWWRRELKGLYCPPLSLREPRRASGDNL